MEERLDFIRRPGGSLEPIRKLGGRTVLLPYEAQLCDTLGISEKEYFQFVELAEVACHERKKGYEHIPDINAGPAAGAFALYATTTTAAGATAITLTALGQVAVGIAISAIGYLLTPKPKTPEAPASLTLGGVQGRSRFAPQSEFSSVQELAVLGTFIPLVYSRKGVRVNSQLLWSHLKTTGSGQILSVITLFSNGELGEKPEFDSFAIGTNFLKDFPRRKLALFFSNGNTNTVFNRLTSADKYSEDTLAPDGHSLDNRGRKEFDSSDPFLVREIINTTRNEETDFAYKESFSSTMTTINKNKFGVFNPMPNAMGYRVPWEVVMFPKGISSSVEQDNIHKTQKIIHKFPRLCGVVASSTKTDEPVEKNDIVKYRITGAKREAPFEAEGNEVDDNKPLNKFDPWGSQDAKAVVDTTRENIDDTIKIGEQYLIGTALVTCTDILDGRIWRGGADFGKDFIFTVDEPGVIDQFRDRDIKELAHHPFEKYTIQQVSIGTISNIRSSDITEIGIKSKVFRRINGFPNVNAMVSRAKQNEYEDKGGNIGLGSMNKFVKRLSFFKLEAKHQFEKDFQDIAGIVFCIQGSSPIEQYNTFQINTKQRLYDFRFMPVPGNFVLRNNRQVYNVRHNGLRQKFTNQALELDIFFNADPLDLPQKSSFDDLITGRAGNPATNNKEWIRAGGSQRADNLGGNNLNLGSPVTALGSYDNGKTKPTPSPIFVDDTTSNLVNKNPNQFGGQDSLGGSFLGSYFNIANGVVVQARSTQSNTVWSWSITYGNDKTPNGVPITFDTAAGIYPVNDFRGPVLGTDGIRRKFALASSVRPLSTRNDVFALKVQKEITPSLATSTFITNPSSISGLGTGLQLSVTKIIPSGGGDTYYSWEIINPGNGYHNGDFVRINDGNNIVDEISVFAADIDLVDDSPEGDSEFVNAYWKKSYLNSNNAISDYYLYDAEDSSHSNNVEHEIIFMNEIEHTGKNTPINYPSLAIAGLRMNSTKEISSFSQLSALIKKGIKVKRLINDSGSFVSHGSLNDSTNNFVEIAYDLLTNEQYGAAELIGIRGVNRGEMQQAALYCLRNGFTWDGVIDRRFNLREFIFENAAFNLLDFSVKGGQFSLRPALPVNNDQTINYDATTDPNGGIDIKALFSDGNMRNLQVSFLTPEEREVFKATILFREDQIEDNGFPETKVKTYAYKFDNQKIEEMRDLPEEVFDLSNWCTSEAQAHLFAAIALATRKEVDHGITFETTPTSVLGLLAGDYIRVISEVTHTSRFTNGSIDQDGFVTCRDDFSGEIPIYYWTPGSLGGVQTGSLQVNSDGKATNGLRNVLFARVDTTEEDRLYKVESISYGEDGFIKVAASHQPLTSDHKLAILHKAKPTIEGGDLNVSFPNILF